ncbi:MAG: hypothetical protein WC365_01765 [Candidatus Babeliales bacterium]|jgi:hypothetical protein
MKKILLGACFIFLTCSAKKPDQPVIKSEMVGGPATTTPLWCRQAESPQEFRQAFSDGSSVYFCTTVNGKTRYLATIKDESSGFYHLGLQDKSIPMIIKYQGTDAITFDLPSPFDPQEARWAAGPWLVWGDPDEVPKNSGAYSGYCKTLKQGEGFLNEDAKGRLVLPSEFASRDTAIKFWCTATEPAVAKEYSFKELSNGTRVTLKVGAKYLNRTTVDLPFKKGVYYFMKPVKEVISLVDTPQQFEVQKTALGIFFMPPGYGKPGTRTMPGFGPFKIVPFDQSNPSLNQVYLQNALDSSTPQYAQIDNLETKNRSVPIEKATIFCIRVE